MQAPLWIKSYPVLESTKDARSDRTKLHLAFSAEKDHYVSCVRPSICYGYLSDET